MILFFKENEIDFIMHLSALYIKDETIDSYKSMFEANVLYPLEIIELSSQYNVKGFINTGSFFEYDFKNHIFNESSKIKPINNYAFTKFIFEQHLNAYSEKLSSVTLKLFSPYNPNDNKK